MAYSKSLFINNVYFLAKARDVKIGELETACGVSAGYLARLRQAEKNSAVGADFLLAAAEYLNVSVDALLTFDFPRASDAEIDLHRYLEKLTRETRSRKLLWQEDLAGYPDTLLYDEKGRVVHPLYLNLPEMNKYLPHYHSMFRLEENLTPVAVYCCPFTGERTLYLVRIEVQDDDPVHPESGFELELVMTGRGMADPVPLCHTRCDTGSRLDKDMNRLLDAVEDSVLLPHLTPEAERMIRDYLADSEGSGENGQ